MSCRTGTKSHNLVNFGVRFVGVSEVKEMKIQAAEGALDRVLRSFPIDRKSDGVTDRASAELFIQSMSMAVPPLLLAMDLPLDWPRGCHPFLWPFFVSLSSFFFSCCCFQTRIRRPGSRVFDRTFWRRFATLLLSTWISQLRFCSSSRRRNVIL